jgi:hypothetical protein
MSAFPSFDDRPEDLPAGPAPVRAENLPYDQRLALSRYGTWQRFGRGPRQYSPNLLGQLGRYPDAVLVAGCQRSGTTMLTRLIAGSAGLRGLALTRDDELDAALALCGEIGLPESGRYCFQTTYLNERYAEYATMGCGHRLIWLLRNPWSVIHSMVYNWRRFALNELFESCGIARAAAAGIKRPRWPWPIGPSRLEKACLSYSAKTSQILEICEMVPREQILVIDYDALVDSPHEWLSRIFAFIDEPYVPAYAGTVSRASKEKASRLSATSFPSIASDAERVYGKCLAQVSGLSRPQEQRKRGARHVASRAGTS